MTTLKIREEIEEAKKTTGMTMAQYIDLRLKAAMVDWLADIHHELWIIADLKGAGDKYEGHSDD